MTISEQIKFIYDAMNITSKMTDAHKKVTKNGNSTNIMYRTDITFTVNDNDELTVNYGMGLGLWTNKIKMGGGYPSFFNLLEGELKHIPEKQARYKQFDPECYVDTIPQRLVDLNIKPWEVFATACREAMDAINYSVSEWCIEFFENVDSKAGYDSYHKCLEQYAWLYRTIGNDNIKKIANLEYEI